MIEIKRILCPVDFSEYSEHALRYAVALARWYEARVTAFHAYSEWPAVAMIPSLGDPLPPAHLAAVDQEAVLGALKAFVGRCPAEGVSIDVVLQEAPDMHRAILAHADALPADLIVLGSHGRSGFERLLLGSITEKVLRKATCPVLVVPRRAADAALSHAAHVQQILCPIDFSDGSLAALDYALSIAEEANARLTLMYVEELPPELVRHAAFGAIDVDEIRLEARAEALRRLRGLVPDSVREYCTVETTVSDGRASRAILRVAAAQKSDLIVMGIQGRGAVDMALFGSNTQEVVRAATCPVLTMRRR